MLQPKPPSSHLVYTWSPHWRSLHPAYTDFEILDALKAQLEKTFAAQGRPYAIAQLGILKQSQPVFRLPNGELCHWAIVTKAASTSILAAIGKHVPHSWVGPHKQYDLPAGQTAGPEEKIPHNSPTFPARIMMPAVSGWRRFRRRLRFAPSSVQIDFTQSFIKCNTAVPEEGEAGIHLLREETFRPRSHATIRFCILRNPVERFVSMVVYQYRRVLHKKDTPINSESLQAYCEQQLKILEDGRPRWENHQLHQWVFVGRDPSYYTHIFRMDEQARLEHFLSDWVGAPVQLPHHNKSQSAEDLQLTPAQKQRVEAYYAADYKIWGKYF